MHACMHSHMFVHVHACMLAVCAYVCCCFAHTFMNVFASMQLLNVVCKVCMCSTGLYIPVYEQYRYVHTCMNSTGMQARSQVKLWGGSSGSKWNSLLRKLHHRYLICVHKYAI